jgi:hypothetical protein
MEGTRERGQSKKRDGGGKSQQGKNESMKAAVAYEPHRMRIESAEILMGCKVGDTSGNEERGLDKRS